MNEADAHLTSRQWMATALIGELYGPHIRYREWKQDLYETAQPIQLSEGYCFADWSLFNLRHTDADTYEEILKSEAPSQKYGIGILFPREDDSGSDEGGVVEEANTGLLTQEEEESSKDIEQERKLSERMQRNLERLEHKISGDGDSDPEEFTEDDPLQLARIRKPSSMGVTCVINGNTQSLNFRLTGGRYRPYRVQIKGKDRSSERRVWKRIAVEYTGTITIDQHTGQTNYTINSGDEELTGLPKIQLEFDIRARALPENCRTGQGYENARLITVTIVNRSMATIRESDKLALFQTHIAISIPESRDVNGFLPLPRLSGRELTDEEKSLRLLYSKQLVFATGHGCAGDWEKSGENEERATTIYAEPVPTYETTRLTPYLMYPASHEKAGEKLSIKMLPLALGHSDWILPIKELLALYDAWISDKKTQLKHTEEDLISTAERHIQQCEATLTRMREGVQLLQSEPDAAKAFQLANSAMILQQLAGKNELRTYEYDRSKKAAKWSRECQIPSLESEKAAIPSWHPFQIAFILMSLKGLWDGQSPDRNIADLIWFPTGGGKTEAYLGATAFTLFARRINDSDDKGTAVLMRYTLRLLTSQQFQRASGLICAMEMLRKQNEKLLGTDPYEIGIWVGSGTTPNKQEQSVKAFEDCQRKGPEEYKHVMLKCPCCGAAMGPIKNQQSKSRNDKYFVRGLRKTGTGDNRRVEIHCPDSSCYFHGQLPVRVVDEEIYEHRPSLVIGTVDKFAMMAWEPRARSIFGIGADGKHEVSPPALIIQDELHLITGPLGSIVGLYEGVIEELCTDRRGPNPVKPKFISATATTRASTQQIRDLYARKDTRIFPPPGFDANDSFFASIDRDDQGNPKAGRLYLGIMARAYASGLTTSVRTFSALLTAAKILPAEQQDPWYSLLVFYNSLRELGASLTLFDADIRERLSDLQKRWTPGGKRRYLNNYFELTGRLANSEIPRALEQLERKSSERGAVDACLASNIIEVGVDVPRLGMMAVVGQPKNSAQYIQASGRVGRSSPGLIVMIYDAKKSRDLSHYEQFVEYHSRLYATVEPASVTPFTIPVMERALHGVMVSWVRMRLPTEEQSDDPRNIHVQGGRMEVELKSFGKMALERLQVLLAHDGEGLAHAEASLKKILNQRYKEWLAWTNSDLGGEIVQWQNHDLTGDSANQPLLRYYGKPCRAEWEVSSWATPTSMRGVDAECPARICQVTAESEKAEEEPDLFA